MLVKLGLPLGCFQKTRATLPVAVFRKLLAADGSGVLPLRKTTSHGATDPFGWKAEQTPVTVHALHATALHATALHLLGLDHERLSYRQNGTERRLTDVHGHVIKAVLS